MSDQLKTSGRLYTEDEMLQLSGIQHYVFCPRQWALIHIEQQWNDNSLTVEGTLLHEVDNATEILRRSAIKIARIPEIDSLRGIEGECAVEYFNAFPHLILIKDPQFSFKNRNRRPPTDPVNAMLSMGYSLLANDCASALEGVGLDPAVGFLHTLRPGRNSLALDLMEEMRAYIVDRLVISLVNTRQVSILIYRQCYLLAI